jgi:hypothetical protein
MATGSHDGLPGPEQDRRSLRRGRMLLTGKIVYGSAPYTFDCTIRDITETGARVRVTDPLSIPNHFLLLDIRRFVAFEAQVKWRRQNEMGLALTDRFSLDDQSNTRNRQLKQIAIEAKQRLGG